MLLFIFVITVLSVAAYFKWFSQRSDNHDILAEYYADKKWCSGSESSDISVQPFRVEINDDAIKDLHHRLDKTRMQSNSLEDSKFRLGIRNESMDELIKYWRDEYSWKEQEKIINQYDHFKTNIEGLLIHFIHIKPKIDNPNIKPKPLLLLHGWPGSFYEFYKSIPMLTDPLNHNGNETDVFEIVIPSIPGYGFSDAPQVCGFSIPHCSRVFHKLMLRLNLNHYYIQGGDWGSVIGNCLAKLYPSSTNGIHVNMHVARPGFTSLSKLFIGSFFPHLFYHPLEIKTIFPLTKIFKTLWKEFGYFHLQSTRPDTIGLALTDSPAGLAAYLTDKYFSWTNFEFCAHSSMEAFYKLISKDDLLTQIMIYWWSGNITSSMRFYQENMLDSKIAKVGGIPVHVPAGFAMVPHELVGVSRDMVAKSYSNLLSFTYMHCGGHFAFFERPKEMVSDLRQFINKVENGKKKEKINEEIMRNEYEVNQSHLDVLERKADL